MSDDLFPRPGNAGRNDYPRMLYHPDGRMVVVPDAAEHDKHAKEGWDTVPSAAHLQRPVSASPIASGADPLAQMFRAVLEEVLDERGFAKAPTRRRNLNGSE